MDYFYLPNIDCVKTRCSLSKEESRHIVKVFRKKEGDVLSIVDGKGVLIKAHVNVADARACEVVFDEVLSDYEKRPYKIRLCVAPTKNISRFEWILEKATEIGVDEIVPLLTSRSERKSVNLERLHKILVAAMKQSQKAYLPRLSNLVRFEDFLHLTSSGTSKYIAHCLETFPRVGLLQSCEVGKDVELLIGPEGDFSEDEIKKAEDKGYVGIHLGPSRLRTETAAIVACSTIYQINFGK